MSAGIASPFTWGAGGEAMTPEEAKRRREIALAMIQQGTSAKPIQHWAQGAANVAQALMGAYEMNLADKAEKGAREAALKRDAGLLGDAPAASAPSSPQSMNINPQAGPVGAPSFGVGVGGMRSPGMASVVAGKPPENLLPLFVQHEQAKGLPQGYLSRTAEIESRFNPNAANPSSSAKGLFQFIDGTRQQYGGFNPMDPAASTDAAARLAADNKTLLVKALGREPTAGELYLAHQQGGGGAAKLLANPNARAADVVGADAVRLNGGNPNMTAGEFANKWVSKFGDQPATAAQASPAAPPSSGSPALGRDAIMRAMQTVNDPYSSPGAKMVAQALIQKSLTQETKDPRDIRLKDLTIAEKEAQASQAQQMNPLAVQEKQLGIKKTERELAGEGATPLTPEERKTIGVPEGQPAYKTRSGEIKFGPAGTRINNNVGGGTDKQFFDEMVESTKDARSAISGLQSIRDARSAVLGGGIFGAGADVRLGLQKLGAALGLTDTDKIVNTETFRSAIAPQVASMLKATVGSANISNSDREFAEKAAGGSIQLDEKSITRLLDIMERGNIGRIQAHNERIAAIYPESEDGKHRRERALFAAPMPTFVQQGPPASFAPAPPASSAVPNSAPDARALREKYGLQ